ncbi:uncharacterized protein LOC128524405 [Clarias gariepinus]|uniref:uncharacterized protein LOC128524405 n=1 Tax=Clarias gariepinus TaxID=13013 RepID=UPI00234D1040|nr:uncharacterized protein LOC128524405 [Clarias gariepinus]
MANSAPLFVLSEMSSEYFTSLNVPASFFSILMNIFFIYCMAFQQREQEQLKQPLNVLQGILVGCNTTINAFTLLKVCINCFPRYSDVWSYVISQCMVYTMMTSVTSSFWQNVFYYCQIIPLQFKFMWLKKNIQVLIYFTLLTSGIVYLFGLSLITAFTVIVSNNASANDTVMGVPHNSSLLWIIVTWYLVFSLTLAMLVLNLCGMSTSSCATVIYLWKHVKNMEESNTLSSPRFQKQIRMTIRSVAIQALLYLICSLGVIVDLGIYMYGTLNYDQNQNILSTIVSFYAFGTSITLGFAQSLFRKQLANAWKRIFPIF